MPSCQNKLGFIEINTTLSLACSARCCSDCHISTGITWLFHSAQLDRKFRHIRCAMTCLAYYITTSLTEADPRDRDIMLNVKLAKCYVPD